jgi:hypothetical protein
MFRARGYFRDDDDWSDSAYVYDPFRFEDNRWIQDRQNPTNAELEVLGVLYEDERQGHIQHLTNEIEATVEWD